MTTHGRGLGYDLSSSQGLALCGGQAELGEGHGDELKYVVKAEASVEQT